MSLRYKWVKFRTMHSSGPGQWEYTELAMYDGESEEKQLKNCLEELDYEYTTRSEHWRGIEGVFEDPSYEYLCKRIEQSKREIEDIRENISRWEEQKRNTVPSFAGENI